jgi:hypothetical protein
VVFCAYLPASICKYIPVDGVGGVFTEIYTFAKRLYMPMYESLLY